MEAPRRATDIEINAVADGYVVYQPAKDRVHYLNHTAALVLELCNGKIGKDEMPAMLKSAFDLTEAPTGEVERCLENFAKEGLIS